MTEKPETPTAQSETEASNHALPLFRKIMITTDFSPNSIRTYLAAVQLAKQFEATIHLVHFGSTKAPEYSGISNESHRKSLRLLLTKELSRSEFAGINVRTSLLDRRDVWRSLATYQEQSNCDLIISSTLAHQGFHRHFNHQLAEKIVASSTVPVLLFGPSSNATGIDNPQSILVPFDFSDKAMAAFPVLRLLASRYHPSIKLMFMQTRRSGWFQRLMGGHKHQIDALEKQFQTLIEQELPNGQVTLDICLGVAETEYGKKAGDSDADLIVIGTYGKLGKLTKAMIRQAPCPVLAVPTDQQKEFYDH